MSSFEDIIRTEKATLYSQRDKELFSFYTLTLITQEQAARKTKRNLWICTLLLTVCSMVLFSPVNQITDYLITFLSNVGLVDIFYMALISYGVSGVLIVMFKSRTSLFD
jgi:hypothetical protein